MSIFIFMVVAPVTGLACEAVHRAHLRHKQRVRRDMARRREYR